MIRAATVTAVALAALSVPAIAGPVLAPAGADTATVDPVRAGQWYLDALHVPQAWRTTRGAGTTVCVIDSGIDDHVPDLLGAVRERKQFTRYVGQDGLVTPHGTGVASVLAGRGHGPDHAAGVIGIAPAANLLDAVVGDSDPNIDQQAANAVRWCTDNGAGVINMSFGVLSNGPMGAAVAYAQARNVVVVAASTNTFEHLDTEALPNPAGLPGVLAVTGIDKDLQHDAGAFNSSVGKAVSIAAPFSTTSGANGYPDVGLPVADVPSADAGRAYALHACGTSYSAPIVAGAAALIRAAHPRWSADEVIAALLATATPRGADRPNRTYGWGILDVGAAVGINLAHSAGNPLVTGRLPALAQPSGPARSGDGRSPVGGTGSAAQAAATPSVAGPRADRAGPSAGDGTPAWWQVVIAAVAVAAGSVAARFLIRRRRAG